MKGLYIKEVGNIPLALKENWTTRLQAMFPNYLLEVTSHRQMLMQIHLNTSAVAAVHRHAHSSEEVGMQTHLYLKDSEGKKR